MDRFLKNKAVLAECKIYQMLLADAGARHVSFHTPGHKVGAWDITELSFSDNLSCPRGCIAEAEKDIAGILGACKSFILTDGSTSGVLSMLQAVKSLGARTIAVCESSHKSVFNGCMALGLTPLVYPCENKGGIPFPPTMYALNERYGETFAQADVLFFTSPDYYGNVVEWKAIREYCDKTGKILLADGAHGGHLHHDKNLHAGGYADMWVEGVHKSLPAFTQGAIVSARTEKMAVALENAVDIFRTTSPSYPIMASVEYAVKYPRNAALEEKVKAFQARERVYQNADWTKLVVRFGSGAFEAEKRLENEGIYAEFCDGKNLTFYLSPVTSEEEFTLLTERLEQLLEEYPLTEEKEAQPIPAPLIFTGKQTEWVDLDKAEGRVCARICGLFPPCVPLFQIGETITQDKIEKMQKANNVFGLKDGKILTFQEEK
ncbi:MAG: aminotransferase class I/II-fold pyridoxal phosphate-dependent enzyme [Clostridia bacterium]|nr:aminotransferase class I/II-fold pyridoxal phosphate-dependent enzyme [Clostridia bacterium]